MLFYYVTIMPVLYQETESHFPLSESGKTYGCFNQENRKVTVCDCRGSVMKNAPYILGLEILPGALRY